MAVLGPPGYSPHQQCSRAGASFWRDVAQKEPGDVHRKGQSLGGTGAVVSPDLSHPGSSDVSAAGRSGKRSVQRHNWITHREPLLVSATP